MDRDEGTVGKSKVILQLLDWKKWVASNSGSLREPFLGHTLSAIYSPPCTGFPQVAVRPLGAAVKLLGGQW